MDYNKFIHYCYLLGIMKRTKVKKSRYDIIEWYRLRLWNPLTWLMYIIAFAIQFYHLIIELVIEAGEEVEIHKKHNSD